MGFYTIDKFINATYANESFATMKLTCENIEAETKRIDSQVTMEQNLKKIIQIYQDYYNKLSEFQQEIANDNYSKKDKIINVGQIIGIIAMSIPTLGLGLIGLNYRRGKYKSNQTKKISDLMMVVAESINELKYLVSKGYKTKDSIINIIVDKESSIGSYRIYEKIPQDDIIIDDATDEICIYKKLPKDKYICRNVDGEDIVYKAID